MDVLRFGFGEAKLGRILVAVSDRGVAAILLGDDAAKLACCFPGAKLVEDTVDLIETIAEVVSIVDQPGKRLGLRLDLRGSA